MSIPARDPNTAGTAALSPFSTPNHELRAPGPGEAHSPFTPTAAPGSQPAGSLSDPEDGPDPTFNLYIQPNSPTPTATTPEASPAAPTTESTETTGPSVATNATEPSESRPAR
uniref:Agnoprotein 1b n=1 Tax=Budgerigar fledgling disease virus TaxID=1891747 RepID=A0A0K1L8R0_BFPYV|nr:agnoprotein 1b [Gammapolyomavirus avis]